MARDAYGAPTYPHGFGRTARDIVCPDDDGDPHCPDCRKVMKRSHIGRRGDRSQPWICDECDTVVTDDEIEMAETIHHIADQSLMLGDVAKRAERVEGIVNANGNDRPIVRAWRRTLLKDLREIADRMERDLETIESLMPEGK